MVRITIDCYDTDDIFAVKELLVMALERLGKVKVVSITDGERVLR